MSNLAKDWQEGTYTIRVKDGEVEVSTIRTITKTYLSCATDVHKRYMATARCAPEDEFSLSMGVALAMDRLNKELGEDKIEVGDKVKIVNNGFVYTTYTHWVVSNVPDPLMVARFAYGQKPNMGNAVYTVEAIAPHSKYNKETLVYVQRYYDSFSNVLDTSQPCYLISIDGLEKV